MSDANILDKILTAKHAEEMRTFNPITVVEHLLNLLPVREKEVVSRRMGIPQDTVCETLEEIGRRLKVTRERVRQITKSSIAKLRSLDLSNDELKSFIRTTEHVLRSYGGALEENFFIEQLLNFSHTPKDSQSQHQATACLRFLLENVMSDLIERRPSSQTLKSLYAIPGVGTALLSETSRVFLSIIDAAREPLTSEELFKRFREISFYKENKDKLTLEPVMIAREFYGSSAEPEAPVTTEEENNVLLAYVNCTKDLSQNIFEEWGRISWSTISPKRMNDKIYLILRHEKKPLHFVNISEKVNAIKFDKKMAKPPSVHNELILDKRFVLVGRGTYALVEWGYHPGTVANVIIELLENKPMKREEIVREVLSRRIVKRQTIHLALLNRKHFIKTPDGLYALVVSS